MLHLVVTFDIKGAKSGDRRYAEVDALLASHGTLHRVFKQVRLLTTKTKPQPLARKPDFVRAFEARTGERAAICDRELDGDYRYSSDDA